MGKLGLWPQVLPDPADVLVDPGVDASLVAAAIRAAKGHDADLGNNQCMLLISFPHIVLTSGFCLLRLTSLLRIQLLQISPSLRVWVLS